MPGLTHASNLVELYRITSTSNLSADNTRYGTAAAAWDDCMHFVLSHSIKSGEYWQKRQGVAHGCQVYHQSGAGLAYKHQMGGNTVGVSGGAKRFSFFPWPMSVCSGFFTFFFSAFHCLAARPLKTGCALLALLFFFLLRSPWGKFLWCWSTVCFPAFLNSCGLNQSSPSSFDLSGTDNLEDYRRGGGGGGGEEEDEEEEAGCP